MRDYKKQLDKLELQIPRPQDKTISDLSKRDGIFISPYKGAGAIIDPDTWDTLTIEEQSAVWGFSVGVILMNPDEL